VEILQASALTHLLALLIMVSGLKVLVVTGDYAYQLV
jgi:hypothetical protein